MPGEGPCGALGKSSENVTASDLEGQLELDEEFIRVRVIRAGAADAVLPLGDIPGAIHSGLAEAGPGAGKAASRKDATGNLS